jgi:hypothetical protein
LADSYADVRKIAGDDKISQSEIEETYGKLDVHREEMRDVCSPIISQASKG